MDLHTYNMYCSKKNITCRLQIEQASNKHLRQAHASKKINHHQHISTGLAAKFSEKQTIIDGLQSNNRERRGREIRPDLEKIAPQIQILEKVAPHETPGSCHRLDLTPTLARKEMRKREKGKGLEGGDGERELVEAHLIHRPPPVSVADGSGGRSVGVGVTFCERSDARPTRSVSRSRPRVEMRETHAV
jgi:hypothetical protein